MVPMSSALTALQNNGDLMSSILVAIAPGPQQPSLNLHIKSFICVTWTSNFGFSFVEQKYSMRRKLSDLSESAYFCENVSDERKEITKCYHWDFFLN